MCLLAIEILFLVAGIWLLISGKIPNKLFQLLFGKGDYQLSALHARLFGLLLSTPLPLVFGVSFILGFLFPKDHPVLFATIFEIIYDIVVAITAIIIARKSRRPIS
jgi:hypothetical protein